MTKVVTTSPGFGRAGELPDRLANTGWQVVRCTAETIAAHLPDAAFLVVGLPAVTAEPPDRTHPIFANPRVIFSPHSGADTTGALVRMGQMVLEDIATLLAGGQPARTVNPAVYKANP